MHLVRRRSLYSYDVRFFKMALLENNYVYVQIITSLGINGVTQAMGHTFMNIDELHDAEDQQSENQDISRSGHWQ